MLVLRAEHQAGELAELLAREGAEPVVVPLIRIVPTDDWEQVDEAHRRLDEFEWVVFTSVNGAQLFLQRALERRASARAREEGALISARVAAIGPATKRALEDAGVHVDWMPSVYTSAVLADELPGPPGKTLLIRAEVAPTHLEEALLKRGFEPERLNIYRTEATGGIGLGDVLPTIDVVAFTSAWIVRCFAEAAGDELRSASPLTCSIGPATSAACRSHGIRVDVEASEHTLPGLVHALAEHLDSTGRS
ncbi:MAG: uroporphyrinogen-III synthase [Actinomycetota bacterium]|nr:uroporphyrinogen-III synthase [Actinomycetota bacterium]